MGFNVQIRVRSMLYVHVSPHSLIKKCAWFDLHCFNFNLISSYTCVIFTLVSKLLWLGGRTGLQYLMIILKKRELKIMTLMVLFY